MLHLQYLDVFLTAVSVELLKYTRSDKMTGPLEKEENKTKKREKIKNIREI